MQKWEYLKRESQTEQELNALGDQGWEMVSAVGLHAGTHTVVIYIFKRPKA